MAATQRVKDEMKVSHSGARGTGGWTTVIRMRHIRVNAIHNQTRPPVKVCYPKTDGADLVIKPGKTAKGPWVIRFDPIEHAELNLLPGEVEFWFIDSATEFAWGSPSFGDGRLRVTDYVRIHDELN
jgi:hypothetical protein